MNDYIGCLKNNSKSKTKIKKPSLDDCIGIKFYEYNKKNREP